MLKSTLVARPNEREGKQKDVQKSVIKVLNIIARYYSILHT